MLPQAPEDAGCYVYGNVGNMPNTGHMAQYAYANLLSLILLTEREWQTMDDRKFGIGNISIDGGLPYARPPALPVRAPSESAGVFLPGHCQVGGVRAKTVSG